tara:strand:- start:115 stop:276 length:162 start_codon:yes stop_codon:yes gene_type:complete
MVLLQIAGGIILGGGTLALLGYIISTYVDALGAARTYKKYAKDLENDIRKLQK